LLITHFGNGDEIDQNVLIDYFEKVGVSTAELTIFPGGNYGHAEFKSVEDA